MKRREKGRVKKIKNVFCIPTNLFWLNPNPLTFLHILNQFCALLLRPNPNLGNFNTYLLILNNPLFCLLKPLKYSFFQKIFQNLEDLPSYGRALIIHSGLEDHPLPCLARVSNCLAPTLFRARIKGHQAAFPLFLSN